MVPQFHINITLNFPRSGRGDWTGKLIPKPKTCKICALPQPRQTEQRKRLTPANKVFWRVRGPFGDIRGLSVLVTNVHMNRLQSASFPIITYRGGGKHVFRDTAPTPLEAENGCAIEQRGLFYMAFYRPTFNSNDTHLLHGTFWPLGMIGQNVRGVH